jgi:feruloyl esterase
MKITVLRTCFLVTSLVAATASRATAESCKDMASLRLPNTTITVAESVSTGAFTPEKPFNEVPGLVPGYDRLPAFCRVAGTVRPTKDSEIKFEVWMPLTGWNGNFQAVGNGVWSGRIWHPFMARALAAGYATANTDTGHEGPGMDGSFALGHPEKVIDYAHRAVHEMTVKSKLIIAAFYGRGPRLSYWNGCSSGGRQGLKEAQEYPDDYDGIIAGAPASDWTGLMASGVWMAQATHKDPATFIPPPKFGMIHAAVIKECDALDGVRDSVIDDPRRCHFDPARLLCAGADGPGCLTAPQVAAAKNLYGGPKNPRTGKQIFPGLEPGSETDWVPVAALPEPLGVYDSHFKYIVFANPQWNYLQLNFDSDIAKAEQMDGNTIKATNPNLTKFVARGGKLILYHGWRDVLIAPRNTINYYEQVVATVGAAQARDAVRLYMVPGMGHCSGGDGPTNFDAFAALERWRDAGVAPDAITATRSRNGTVVRSRPLCPYPKRATYRGSGSTDDAANFTCSEP